MNDNELRIHIETNLDPGAVLRSTDDPAEIVASLNDVFAADGGCGVTVEQMRRYLRTLTD